MLHKQGFTLIEVLAVVIIITILTSVAVPQYRRAIQKSHATEAIAMLRVINDSSERLAINYGYRDFKTMSSTNSPDKEYASFTRMDMFDEHTLKCAIGDTTITCEKFTYNLNRGGDYIAASSNDGGATILLYRGDMPVLRCTGDEDLCDIYNIEYDEVNS